MTFPRMKTFLASALLVGPMLAAAPALAVERIERGQLVIEGIPDIPPEVTERLRTYQNVRGHGFQGFTADGGILISTRFGETSQIHKVSQPMGARRQLTFYDEPVGGASVSPDGRVFAFSKDTGGDEFNQGYLFDPETGRVTRFTNEGTRNGGALWFDDASKAAYYEAQRGAVGWDIYVADPRTPGSAKRVYDSEGPALFPVDWSDDGTKLLLQEYVSITKSRLFILDLASGALSEINPDDTVAYGGGEFVGNGVLTTSDKDAEFRNLVLIDLETGATRDLTPDIDWSVEGFDLSPDGRTAVISINEEGYGTLRLVDVTTGKVSPGPALPKGIASGARFDVTGERVGFTFNGPKSAGDVWTYSLADGALTQWTEAEVGGLDPSGFVEPELISYPGADDLMIPAWVYKPEGAGPFPVIISIHGGPEAQSRPGFSSTVQYWVKELGVAVLVPNVRGSDGYGKTYVAMDNGFNRKKSVGDIGSLLDWIETQPDLASDRVVVYGGSYGGYMVLAAMVDYADRLAGGVNIVGISNFVTFLENTQDYRRDLRRVEYGDERDPEMRAFLEEISPLNSADKITKPLFIIQGLNDPRVPASEAEQILAAMRAQGAEAWYLLAKDEGHGFRKKSNRDYQRDAETLFLRQTLGIE
jgi:dipeptidyl aminopeptidase/acylaminoacyl peptidase